MGCKIHSLPHDDLEFVCVIYHAPFLNKSKEPRTGGIKLCCLSGKDQSISAYPPRGRLVDQVIGESTTDSNLRRWPSPFASEARPMLSLSKTIMPADPFNARTVVPNPNRLHLAMSASGPREAAWNYALYLIKNSSHNTIEFHSGMKTVKQSKIGGEGIQEHPLTPTTS